MTRKEEYLYLLSLTYEEAVKYLLDKYGPVKDDYFNEKSYQRFLKEEIKNIAKGKYSRSSEGLECHHVDENRFLNMTQSYYIKKQAILFKYQTKGRLVYCDLIEHTILHALIAKETNNKYGYPGYVAYLSDKVRDWYLDKNIPKVSKWQIISYQKSYLSPEDAFEILKKMNDKISDTKDVTFINHFIIIDNYDGTFPKTLDEYYKLANEKDLRSKLWEKYVREKEEIREELMPKTLAQAKKINSNSTRHEIVNTMYNLNMIGASSYLYLFHQYKYSEKYKQKIYQPVAFEIFEYEMSKYDIDGILKNIQAYIDYLEGVIDCSEYSTIRYLYSKTTKEVEDEKIAKEEKIEEHRFKKEKFYSSYPAFESYGINYDIKRQEVNVLLFGYDVGYPSFIKFQAAMKTFSMDELLNKLHLILLD